MHMTVVLSEEIGQRVRQLPDPDDFIAKAVVRALEDREARDERIAPVPERRRAAASCLSNEDRRRWLGVMQSLMTTPTEPIGVEALLRLSRESELAPNELSRDIIEAREE